jgi:hypothetical protein
LNSWHLTMKWWINIWIKWYFILLLQIMLTLASESQPHSMLKLFQNVDVSFSLQLQSKQTAMVACD